MQALVVSAVAFAVWWVLGHGDRAGAGLGGLIPDAYAIRFICGCWGVLAAGTAAGAGEAVERAWNAHPASGSAWVCLKSLYLALLALYVGVGSGFVLVELCGAPGWLVRSKIQPAA